MSVAVVTVCSDPTHPGLARLQRSCDRWGWPLHPVVREWWPLGFWTKPAGVRGVLPELKAKGVRWVIAVDAYDVVACGPREEVEPHLTGGCLFSAEIAPWPPVPDANLKDKYPERQDRWKYVNSGGYLGEIDFLADYVLAGDPPLGDEWTGGGEHSVHRCDDQLWMASKYLTCPRRDAADGCRLDVSCSVFQTLAHTDAPWNRWFNTFAVEGERVGNKDTGTLPLFVHGNGGGDNLYWCPGGAT